MNKDPYATAEESASVMAKNVNPGRKSAIEHVGRLIEEKFLDEQGVSDAAYTRGLHAIAVDLAEKNAELLEALQITRGNIARLGPAGALKPYMPYQEWLAMVDAVIAKATSQP